MCTWQACCPRLDKVWSNFFTEHTFFPRVPDQSVTWQEEWSRLSSQFGGRFLNSFRKGWAQIFMLLWLETLSTLFFGLQLCIILWCMLLSSPYSQSEIASLNGWMLLKLYKSWRILYLRKTDPFLLPVVARQNLLVMREVSVVFSWMDPKVIVDLFFGLPQLGWAMPAPTMQCREAPPEYPIEALKTDCVYHKSKLLSRCRPSGDDKIDAAAWEKRKRNLGPFSTFNTSRFLVSVYFASLVLGSSMAAPKIQLCG